MSWGVMGVDWETRVDYDRLRTYRLNRAKEQLVQQQIGAYLCFDFNNIRYLTGVHIGEWARDKMHRYAVLPRGGEPILFEFGFSRSCPPAVFPVDRRPCAPGGNLVTRRHSQLRRGCRQAG